MILPTKHVRPDRALVAVGAEVLTILKRPMTMSRLWDEMRGQRSLYAPNAPIDYQWFNCLASSGRSPVLAINNT